MSRRPPTASPWFVPPWRGPTGSRHPTRDRAGRGVLHRRHPAHPPRPPPRRRAVPDRGPGPGRQPPHLGAGRRDRGPGRPLVVVRRPGAEGDAAAAGLAGTSRSRSRCCEVSSSDIRDRFARRAPARLARARRRRPRWRGSEVSTLPRDDGAPSPTTGDGSRRRAGSEAKRAEHARRRGRRSAGPRRCSRAGRARASDGGGRVARVGDDDDRPAPRRRARRRRRGRRRSARPGRAHRRRRRPSYGVTIFRPVDRVDRPRPARHARRGAVARPGRRCARRRARAGPTLLQHSLENLLGVRFAACDARLGSGRRAPDARAGSLTVEVDEAVEERDASRPGRRGGLRPA